MDEDHYDEFGNYIGPELLSDSSEEAVAEEKEEMLPENIQIIRASNEHKIVLHEDKKYYQAHEEMYPEAQIMIQQEDRQPLQTPLISKTDEKCYDYCELLDSNYKVEYLLQLMKNPSLIRNVCVAGHLHHGKTLFMDMLIQHTHTRQPMWTLDKNYRWLDSRVDEQQKMLSIKASPITLLLQNHQSKHYVFNFMDTPGHPNFIGELAAGLRVCDGVLLVVDAIEGVMLMTEKIIRLIVREKLKVIVVVNKIDRLIIQLKIPPEDAYLKIKHTLQEINGVFLNASSELGLTNHYLISPALHNVVFASAEYGFMFTLDSMARKYKEKFPQIDHKLLRDILWGDYFFHSDSRKFSRKPQEEKRRTFLEFILEPIYKIFAHTVGKDKADLEGFLFKNLKVTLSSAEYKMNIKTMIKLIMSRYFSQQSCLADVIVDAIDPPNLRNRQIVNNLYRGSAGLFKDQIAKCSKDGPLLINTVKMYHEMDYKTFNVFGRVISGTLRTNDLLKIMGQSYEPGQEEDSFVRTAKKVFILQGRFKIEVDEVTAGNFVLISGIDQAVTKTATLVLANSQYSDIDIMIPIKYWTQPTIKVAIEPLIPSQLPKMIEAIRRVNKSYLLLKSKVQESGEHVLIGNGEMHLDCILFDIRNLYSDVEVRISDPSVCFCETVIETSGIPCFADTPNKKNRLKALAGPLERGITDNVEKELVNVNNVTEVKQFLQSKYDWDILASANVWSFGPEHHGANAFVNDTLASTVDQAALQRVRQSIVQGFKWSTRQGPLCDQPMRNVKFRLIDAQLSNNPMDCHPGQLIPTARRAFYSAFLTANPRLMEPVYFTEIQCTSAESIDAVFTVLAKRRGAIQTEVSKAGTPHYIIKALLPCIEALGFETDLRAHTIGQAFCVSTFDHWQMLPGDPLDKNVVLRPLEVLEPHELAREFMIKTRRRKGLNEQVSIVKYFDDLNIKELLKNDASFRDFI